MTTPSYRINRTKEYLRRAIKRVNEFEKSRRIDDLDRAAIDTTRMIASRALVLLNPETPEDKEET